MRQGDVARKHKTERHPICRRQRDEAQKAAEPGERQGYPDRADHDGRGDERRMNKSAPTAIKSVLAREGYRAANAPMQPFATSSAGKTMSLLSCYPLGKFRSA